MQSCLSLPFDQYQRYKIVSDIINKFRTDKKKFRILDIGAGFEEILKKFLPHDDIYYLDKEFPPEFINKENFIPGDILKIELTEKYDFVIAVDIFEHISLPDREKFIDIIIRLSEIVTIIAAPFDRDDVRKCESDANTAYKKIHGSDYIWLKEHQINGLPSLPDTLDLIKKHHLQPITIPNGYLPRWLEMISVYLSTVGKPEFDPIMTALFEFYNKTFYRYDNRNPAYRDIIIIPKNVCEINFSDLVIKENESTEEPDQHDFLKSFIEKIYNSNQITEKLRKQEAEAALIERNSIISRLQTIEQENAAKDIQLDKLAKQVLALEQEKTDKNAQLNEMADPVQDFKQKCDVIDNCFRYFTEKVQTLEQENSEKDTQLRVIIEKIKRLELEKATGETQINQLTARIKEKEIDYKEISRELAAIRQHVEDADQIEKTKDREMVLLNIRLNDALDEIKHLKSSATFQVMAKIQKKIIDPLFPHGTRRRKLYDFGLKGCRVAASQGIAEAWDGYKRYRRTKRFVDESPSVSQPLGAPATVAENIPQCEDIRILTYLHNRNVQKTPEYVPFSKDRVFLTKNDIRCIAFYLPQFHPIPENDLWWGKGFTEWTNVSKAIPQFIGHYQPHLPDELGFYDLRLPEIQERQIELARHYGIYGFCFHYYWFNGRRLLERPLNQFLEHKDWDFPFCICWANENWTRRWDGMEHDVLISQVHSPENDVNFIRDVEPILRDPRYIRIDKKPLLVVYRAGLLPNAKETTQRWREYCRACGIGEIYLVAALAFECHNPEEFGFDAAVEFPPHTMGNCTLITEKMQVLNPQFSGHIYDFREFVQSKKYRKEYPFRCFRCVSPGWDNTARRQNNPAIFFGADPAGYKEWLLDVARETKEKLPPAEQIVFINAWNEWAEGTHLEPDRKFGYGYLQATADVIQDMRDHRDLGKKKIIVVSHDAHPHGAQFIILNIVKKLHEQFHYNIQVILKEGGSLKSEFEKYAIVHDLKNDYLDQKSLEKLIESLFLEGFHIALTNTVVAGDLVPLLSKKKIHVVSLIHELPGIIRDYHIEDRLQSIADYSDYLVFPSDYVKNELHSIARFDETKGRVVPQGLYLKNCFKNEKNRARKLLRDQLNLPQNAKIVLGAGYADYRKGVDIFADIALRVIPQDSTAYFVWVGHGDDSLINEVRKKIQEPEINGHIIFTGRKEDMSLYFTGSDLYLLTSREDPFPSVVLESLDAGVPVVGFDNAGGFRDIITEDTGILVPYLDIPKMSEGVVNLLKDPSLRECLGERGADLVDRKFRFEDYVYTLLDMFNHNYLKISVIIPNYNYERYLQERTDSILQQEYPVYEIIFLDDCSSDGSIKFIENFSMKSPIRTAIIKNPVNSGSVFYQWAQGISQARGDYIWIAEADDLAKPGFLSNVTAKFSDPDVILSYAQSEQIDENGMSLAPDYLDYTNDVDNKKWHNDYIVDGYVEICNSLAIKNTIPNVSGVVFRKVDLTPILHDMIKYKVVGDWFFYIWILQKGKIAFTAKTLNMHRRHRKGVTLSENNQHHFNEIVEIQEFVIQKFDIGQKTCKKIQEYREKVKKYLLV